MVKGIIIGTGSYLPVRTLSNVDLEKMVDTTDEWITTRTGIQARHIAGRAETTSIMASEAARRALDMAGVAPTAIDLIVVGTISAEYGMPSCACLVQKEIGAVNAFAFDINAACSGFLYGLDLADRYVRANPDMTVLLIGVEALSTRVDWQDRGTCVLFGDGAGACVVKASDDKRGMLASHLRSDGRFWDMLSMRSPAISPFEPSPAETDEGFIRMNGRDVFKHAVRDMNDAVDRVLADLNLSIDDIRLAIPHQANIRIINSLVERLHIPAEKIYINIHKYGNTSAASIPIAIDEANREGRLSAGDLLLLCAFGGGLTWGASVIRW